MDSFFGRIAKRFGFVREKDVAEIIAAMINDPSGIASEKTYAQLVDAYKSWVYTAVDKIGKTVPMLPLRLFVYRRKGQKILDPYRIKEQLRKIETAGERKYFLKDSGLEKQEIFEHPFLSVQRKPNSIMTRYSLWYNTLIRMEVAGIAGWLIERNGLGLPAGIKVLPAQRSSTLAAKPTATMDIDYWSYKDGPVNIQIPPADLIVFMYPNPASPFLGMSPLMAQTYPYDIDLFLMQQQRSLFENRAIPGLHLWTEQKLTKPQVTELKQQINEGYAGAVRSGKTMITHSGLKADKNAWSARDAMVTEVAKWAREKLITSYDLSEGKLGLVSDVNRANMEALNDTFILECIKPKTMLIEEAIETFLLPQWDQGLTCDFDLPDTGNREAQRQEDELRLKYFIDAPNDYLERRGEPGRPWGAMPWIPLGVMQPGTSLVLPVKPPKEEPGDQYDEELEEELAVGGDVDEEKKNGSGLHT